MPRGLILVAKLGFAKVFIGLYIVWRFDESYVDA